MVQNVGDSLAHIDCQKPLARQSSGEDAAVMRELCDRGLDISEQVVGDVRRHLLRMGMRSITLGAFVQRIIDYADSKKASAPMAVKSGKYYSHLLSGGRVKEVQVMSVDEGERTVCFFDTQTGEEEVWDLDDFRGAFNK